MDYYQKLRGERNGYVGQNRVLNDPIANKIRVIRERKEIFQGKRIYRRRNLNSLNVSNNQNPGMQNTRNLVFNFLKETFDNSKHQNSELTNSLGVLLQNKDSLDDKCINTLYLHCNKDLKKESNKEMLIDCLLNEAKRINKVKFARNNKALNAKDKAENFRGNIRKGKELGKGGLGAVYELDNDKDYVVKVPHAKNRNALFNANIDAKEEFQKAEKLRGIIENYIKDYNFAGAQGLENAAAPVQIIKGQGIYGRTNELVMPKAEGKDGDKFIFGDPEKGKAPIGIYGNKVGYNNFTITSRRAALSIALQKAMILRALNDGGYANIDTKLENIMISEDGKVSMIDLGSIEKQGNEINVYTSITRAPEVDFDKPAGPKADVFSDAIDRPYVLFGSIANKYLPRFQDHAELFIRCEGVTDRNVLAKKREYLKSGFKEPTFPEYFTNAQKMRYMYYHLGFLKIQKETGEIYPPEVLDSLAKLQALSTEPDPEKRISERVVEDVLLNLMASIDQWKEPGVYRIEGEKITPGSMTDEILPKNKSVNKENIQQNNKNRGNRIQDGIREIRLIRNDRVENKRQNNDSAARINNKQRQDFIEKRNLAQNKNVNLKGNLPNMRQLLAKANKNDIKIDLGNKESPRRRYQLLNGKK